LRLARRKRFAEAYRPRCRVIEGSQPFQSRLRQDGGAILLLESSSAGTGGALWTPVIPHHVLYPATSHCLMLQCAVALQSLTLCHVLEQNKPFGASYFRNKTVLEYVSHFHVSALLSEHQCSALTLETCGYLLTDWALDSDCWAF